MRRFITLWTHPEHPPDRVSREELDAVERQLGMDFPDEYRRAALDFGLPQPVIELWDAVFDSETDCRPLGDFLEPGEIVSITQDWREMGLSQDLVAFATDGRGNLFCFPTQPVDGRQPVFLFDHDEGDADIVATSFDQWIEGYCELAPH